MQIPCLMIRGGTSRGAYFHARDLPDDDAARDAVLLRAMGGPDPLQVDGMGGGHPLTNKVAVISPSFDPDVDLDYLFLQVDPDRRVVSDTQNCGNILAGVGVFAIEEGLVEAADPRVCVRVRMLNTGAICHLDLETEDGHYQDRGTTSIDGVPGTSAPIVCNYLGIAGSSCGELLPTGSAVDIIDGIQVTCIDNGMPVVVMSAQAFGLSGSEAPEALDDDSTLKERLETIRLQAGVKMNLGDVSDKTVPKMCLVSPPREGGAVNTRTFIPHVCHRSIGVLGAVSVATACLLAGSPVGEIADVASGDTRRLDMEHPSGSFTVQLELDENGAVIRAGVIRTARLLFKGDLYV